VSLRSSLWRYLGLLAVAALAVGVFAGPASAKKLSAKQRAAIRTQLRKEIKKNPKAISRKSFIKRASLVNFKLPVTIRLRDSSSANNPNSANVDLGASLGQREVDLGGKLAAEIVFHDSYDGGALGNVDLSILPSATKSLTSTSIPLLWNTDVSRAGTSWDSTLLKAGGFSDAQLTALGHDPGCGDVNTQASNSHYDSASGNLGFGVGALSSTGTPQPGGPGLPGVPIHNGGPTGPTVGFAPAHVASTNPNVDNTIDAIQASKSLTGIASVDNNHVGGNPQPFPYSASSNPGGFVQPPSPKDTVLRTNALNLTVATPGTQVPMDGTGAGDNQVSGSQNIVLGKSGGQANLFGNIPGKSYGIDVTVNLATRINSILRIEDQDAFEPLIQGGNWPAAVFSCSQVWTGGIQNYIPSVHLVGNLKISPGITSDGHLRIAKATVASPVNDKARFAVAACLAPYSAYNTEVPANYTVPGPAAPGGTLDPSQLPADSSSVAPAPAAACNAAPSPLVANSALPPSTVQSIAPAAGSNGYTVSNTGASVSVGADLSVTGVTLDVLVGDV
jgi:hypothetical protein